MNPFRIAPLAAVIMLAIGTAAVRVAADDDAAVRSFHSANGLLQRGLYDLAAQEYRRFLEARPTHEKADVARYGLGVCLARLNQFDAAADALAAIAGTAAFEFGAETGLLLGRCRMAQSRFADAADCFARTVRDHAASPIAPDAAALHVEALYRATRFGEAADAAGAFIAERPSAPQRDRVELFGGMGSIEAGDLESGAARLSSLLQRSPGGEFADRASFLLAQTLHRRGDSAAAIAQYRAVLKGARTEFEPESMLGLAMLLADSGDGAEAANVLDDLLSRHPTHECAASAAFQRGRVWFSDGRFEQADSLFARAAERGYAGDEVSSWRARCDLRRGRFEAAAQRLEVALATYAASSLAPEMRYDLAVALMRANDRRAADALGAFVQQHPEHPLVPEAIYLRAAVHHQQGRYDRSRELCLEFLRRFPDHERAGETRHLLADGAFLAGDLDAAVAAYRGLLERFPGDAQAADGRFRLATALFRLGRHDEAERELNALPGEPAGASYAPAVSLMLAEIAFERGQFSKAEQHYQSYLAAASTGDSVDDARLRLGLAQLRQAKASAAVATFDELIAASPGSPHRLHAMFERGQALLDLREDAAAQAAFEQVVNWPENERFVAHALNHLGSLATAKGDYRRAAAIYERIEGLPSLPPDLGTSALYNRGQVLLAAGEHAAAIAALAAFVEQHAQDSRVLSARAQQAMGLSRLGRHDEALRIIDELGAATENLPPSLRASLAYDHAWSLRSLDRTTEARSVYEALLLLQPADGLRAQALLELADLELAADQPERAIARLDELTSMSSFAAQPIELREQARYRAALCRYEAGRHGEAADHFGAFTRDFPESKLIPAAHAYAGESAYQAGRMQAAAAHFTEVVEHHTDHPHRSDAMLRLGESQARLQDWTSSEETFARFLLEFPESTLWFQAQFGIAWAMENRGEAEKAIAAYQPVVDRHRGPTAARAQFQIGECLFSLHRLDDAVRELLKVEILYAYPEWSAAALYEAGRCFETMARTEWAKLAAQRLTALAGASPANPGGPSGP
jgi:TolA-binding protein